LDAVVTATQFLWINIDTFAVTSLATEPASERLMDRKPDIGDPTMSTNLEKLVGLLVFNAFVFAQIFNSANRRRLDSKLNSFEGLVSNPYFIVNPLTGM
jgi:Ca2+-transporting ATPase